ncbi:MAG: hypothetical protein KDA84_06060 [Planctomycetaceae bacterium]|nr:hypothetical protein [Planctomycetaceae bacterium]
MSIPARVSTATCPLGRWKELAYDKHGHHNPLCHAQSFPLERLIPKLTPTTQRLATVTCLINPCRYKLIGSNYHRFVQALPQELELRTIELTYSDASFHLPDGPRMLRVRGDERQVLWQKEWLLNLAIESLPSDVVVVAWLNADLI